MVKFYVIHILQKKENGGGKTRQEEEEEEEITGAKEKMQIQSRRCKRESSAVGGLGGSQRPPRRRGGTRQQHEKEAQQWVQHIGPREAPPLSTVRMAGAVMVTGHSFQLPSLAGPFISISVAPQHHYPPPSAHLPEQKRLARILGATFVSQFLNLHFYYRKI